MNSIGETINRLSQISSTIASAVEQQTAATQEISRSISVASVSSREVSSAISDVETAAENTGKLSGGVLSASVDLSKDAQRLRNSIENFLAGIRA